MRFRVQVADWWAWSSDRASRQAWIDWAIQDGSEPEPEDGSKPIELPMNIRRRLGPLHRLTISHAAGLSQAKGAVIVTCSRHGDFQRTMRVLDSILGNGEVSPTDFALSVHNGLAGVLSLVLENRNGHTALAAGVDSFAFGLLEAMTVLERDRLDRLPVLLVFADEPMPSAYDGLIEPQETTLAAAFMLEPGLDPKAAGPQLEVEMLDSDGSTNGSAYQAECFLRSIIAGTTVEAVGSRIGWRTRPC
jgi:hypothetical protein